MNSIHHSPFTLGLCTMQSANPRRVLKRLAARLGLTVAAAAASLGATQTAWAAPGAPDLRPVAQKARPSTLPADWARGTFMEFFVRGYRDSNGDGIGDLKGLTAQLDYIKDLGVTGIWLMPITESADRDHGYATTDFRRIEPQYGTLADFDELLKQAHARGIGVIIDYVLNHSSHQHPLFQAALKSPKSPYRSWFVWQDDAPQGWDIWGKNPWYLSSTRPWEVKGELKDLPKPPAGSKNFYFGTFGPHMPDFNLRNPAVVEYHRSSMRFWLNRGLDGFRLDAVPHLIENDAVNWNDQPESRQLTADYTRLIQSYGGRYVVCEATANPAAYAAPNVCGSAFAFGQERNIIQAARGDVAAVAKVAEFFNTAPLSMATMLSNHDIFAGERLWDQLGGDEARYKLAAATYLLQPGVPFIYYGEEIGMGGVRSLKGDDPLRTPMSWTPDIRGFTAGSPYRPLSPNAATHNAAAQARDPQSIHAVYKSLLALRKSHPAIAKGGYRHAAANGHALTFQRTIDGETILVVINYGAAAGSIAVPGLPATSRLESLLQRSFAPGAEMATPAAPNAAQPLTLPPLSVGVYRIHS
jgi:alpha-amylase